MPSKKNQKNKNKIKASNSAWEDEADANVQVDIESVARLRKLRKNNTEKSISGIEYQERLKDFYKNKLAASSFYRWAAKGPENAEN
jgi:hypothetical protein